MQLKRVFSTLFAVSLVAGVALAFWFRQDLYDWYRLKDYTPPKEIATLADNTTMTDFGKRLFYVHKPQLEDRETFNSTCTHYEQTIVLGCYISHRSIHIFDVEDERLQGIREVTAAHEMLHAAYDRLGVTDKKIIDEKVFTHYEKIKRDYPRVRETINGYLEREPEVFNNELHSIMATEVRDLSPELEEYYSQFFSDRQKIVDYAEAYEQVFVEQQQKLENLNSEIQQLEAALQGRRAEIEAEGQALQDESNRLANLRNNNQIEEYNAAVPGYNQRVEAYRSSIEAFNSDIQRLNSLIKDYNKLAVQQKELNNAINSQADNL